MYTGSSIERVEFSMGAYKMQKYAAIYSVII